MGKEGKTDFGKMSVQMSDKQFSKLIQTILSLAPQLQKTPEKESKGSFSNCPTRFSGQRDNDAVEVFIDAIEAYKEVEHITDKDALKGISLLFTGLASSWWKGVRREAKTWNDALTLLREHFAPTRPPYLIYQDIFDQKQEFNENIDTFICRKRVLLAKLPENRHDEQTEIDFIYGQLSAKYIQHIPRHDIKSFRDLLEKGRNLERHKN